LFEHTRRTVIVLGCPFNVLYKIYARSKTQDGYNHKNAFKMSIYVHGYRRFSSSYIVVKR